MTLGRSTTSGAIKIKTDGGLRAVECDCCPLEDLQTYSETHWWDECPTTSEPCPSYEGASASCAGQTITGELVSKSFPITMLAGKTPKADVNADFDDFGSIGSLSCDETGYGYCAACSVSGTIDPQVVTTGDTFVLKVAFTATNAYWGGPYGINASARFYFE